MRNVGAKVATCYFTEASGTSRDGRKLLARDRLCSQVPWYLAHGFRATRRSLASLPLKVATFAPSFLYLSHRFTQPQTRARGVVGHAEMESHPSYAGNDRRFTTSMVLEAHTRHGEHGQRDRPWRRPDTACTLRMCISAPTSPRRDGGRAHQAQDLALRRAAQLGHGDELQDALLDVLHAVVRGVERLLRLLQVVALLVVQPEGDGGQPVQVRASHVELRARRL